MQSGYMGRGGGDHGHGGHHGNMDEGGNGAMDFDNASGDKRRGGAAANREYIDYDDPTQFDRDGQRIEG